MSNDVVGFSPSDADGLIRLLNGGGSSTQTPGAATGDSGIWRYFGKLTTEIEPGDTDGEFTVWNLITNMATSLVIKNVVLPSAATSNAPAGVVLGITRCGYTGRWILDVKYGCE